MSRDVVLQRLVGIFEIGRRGCSSDGLGRMLLTLLGVCTHCRNEHEVPNACSSWR